LPGYYDIKEVVQNIFKDGCGEELKCHIEEIEYNMSWLKEVSR